MIPFPWNPEEILVVMVSNSSYSCSSILDSKLLNIKTFKADGTYFLVGWPTLDNFVLILESGDLMLLALMRKVKS